MITISQQSITNAPLAHRGGAEPTIWGLTPTAIHDRFWAARGVQVVRPGETSETVEGAELFLLMPAQLFACFRLGGLVQDLSWLKPDLIWVRLADEREHGYAERPQFDETGNFCGFNRQYGSSDTRLGRVILTSHRRYAELWRSASSAREGARRLREQTSRDRRHLENLDGRCYERTSDLETMQFMRDVIRQWRRPSSVINRAKRLPGDSWRDLSANVDRNVSFIGPSWVGAGRKLESTTTVVGPAVLWDDPDYRPEVDKVAWDELEPSQVLLRGKNAAARRTIRRPFKRGVDIALASLGLATTLPLYPLVMTAIYIEDGRPFFFGHKRETVGGREFNCLKFRSMRRDADEIKAKYQQENQVDGPQFYIPNDPRITRVGRFLRKTYLDEIPQFVNVLMGHMSMVGPRPSPRAENQYCPPWREARLSVLPGITGLWQVKRSRDLETDFQEWIRYDLEYVEKGGLRMDCWILWKTLIKVLFRR